jgi:sirohydrochlorin ferrochelatase
MIVLLYELKWNTELERKSRLVSVDFFKKYRWVVVRPVSVRYGMRCKRIQKKNESCW